MVVRLENPCIWSTTLAYGLQSHIKVNLSNQQRFFLLILKFTLIWIFYLGAYVDDELKIL